MTTLPTESAPAQSWRGPLLLAGLAACGFFLLRQRALTGDAAAYAITIDSGNLIERSLHLGYYVAGFVLSRMLIPLGLSLDQVLVWSNVVIMAAALVTCWRWFEARGTSTREAGLATFAVLLTGNVLFQGSHAEIYALQFLCCAGSWLAFERRRPIVAGLLFGWALWITPLAMFACAPLFERGLRRGRRRDLVVALGLAAGMMVIGLLFIWREYMFGTRGLITAGERQPFGLGMVAFNTYATIKSFHLMSFFIPLGAWLAWRNRHRDLPLIGLTLLFHIPIMLTMRDEGVFMIPAYPVFALLAARGMLAVADTFPRPMLRPVAAAVLGGFGVTAWFLFGEVDPPRLRENVVEFLETAPAGSAVVAEWNYSQALRYYHGIEQIQNPLPVIVEAEYMTSSKLQNALDRHATVFVIEKFYPRRLTRMLMRVPRVAARYRTTSLLGTVGKLVPGMHAVRVEDYPDQPEIYEIRGPAGARATYVDPPLRTGRRGS